MTLPQVGPHVQITEGNVAESLTPHMEMTLANFTSWVIN